jgi:hypothetical protein
MYLSALSALPPHIAMIINAKDDALRRADQNMRETIKTKDDALRLTEDALRRADQNMRETIKTKDETIKSKDDALRHADETIKSKTDSLRRAEETVTLLNSELFVARGKLTLRAAIEEVEKTFVTESLLVKKGQSMRDCVWTWLLTNSSGVKSAFKIEGQNNDDVLRWVEVAKSMYRHGSEPLHYLPSHGLVFNTQGLSEDQVTFTDLIFKLLRLKVARSP